MKKMKSKMTSLRFASLGAIAAAVAAASIGALTAAASSGAFTSVLLIASVLGSMIAAAAVMAACGCRICEMQAQDAGPESIGHTSSAVSDQTPGFESVRLRRGYTSFPKAS